jgi:hypothetical protein
MAKNVLPDVRRTTAMAMPFFPTMISMFHTLFGYPPLVRLIEEPTPDALTAYRNEYAHRAGYRLGANGEWIAELPTEHPVNR